jgi:hypothetical protein
LTRRISSFAANSAAFSQSVALLERVDGRRPDLFRVLMYHRVDEPDAHPALYPGLISATPAAFDQQMRYLAGNYRVLSMPEVLDACRTRTALPPRAVVITFDDAYCDFAEHAWPTLQRYSLPATLLVPTAFPDHTVPGCDHGHRSQQPRHANRCALTGDAGAARTGLHPDQGLRENTAPRRSYGRGGSDLPSAWRPPA